MGKFRWVRLVARFEPIRFALFKYSDKRYMRLVPVHPFDKRYGIKTSGFLPGSVLRLADSDKKNTAHIGYLGVQPSIIRRALNLLPQHNNATFVDLGCGKGRALAVASEFPFRSVIGVELSPELVRVARKNAQVMAQNVPEQASITVVKSNALDYALPGGDLVIFLYNPFGEHLIRELLVKIETALLQDVSVWVLYINPVWGHFFDASPVLSRIYAESVPYDPSEIGFGPDSSDVVVIWQDAKRASLDAAKGADRRIVVTDFGRRAELAD